MMDNARVAGYSWQTDRENETPAKGNMVLVRYAMNRDGTGYSVQPKARCVWPSAMQYSDSRYLSRRVQAKA